MTKKEYTPVKIIVHGAKRKEFSFKFNFRLMEKICHQRKDRSFLFFGKKFPICARCVGLYLGFLSGALFFKIFLFYNFKFYEIIFFLIFGISPLLIDGFTQLQGLRESNNILRLITGFLGGASFSIFLIYIFSNLTIIFIL